MDFENLGRFPSWEAWIEVHYTSDQSSCPVFVASPMEAWIEVLPIWLRVDFLLSLPHGSVD